MKWAANCENTFWLTINSRSQYWHCVIALTVYCVLLSTSDSLSVVCMYSITVLNLLLFCLCCSVELDFKVQEDKLQPLMKRLCPADESLFPPLPYPQETIGSTPKRKSKAEAKKHARWKLWFMWPQDYTQLTIIFPVQEFSDREHLFTSFAFWSGQIRKILSDCILFIYLFIALLVLYGHEYWTRFGNTAVSISKKTYIYVYLTEFGNFLLEKWINETISLMQSVKLF